MLDVLQSPYIENGEETLVIKGKTGSLGGKMYVGDMCKVKTTDKVRSSSMSGSLPPITELVMVQAPVTGFGESTLSRL